MNSTTKGGEETASEKARSAETRFGIETDHGHHGGEGGKGIEKGKIQSSTKKGSHGKDESS